MTLGAFDLFKRLDVVVLGTVHDREDFGHKMRLIPGPMTAGACIQRFHSDSLYRFFR